MNEPRPRLMLCMHDVLKKDCEKCCPVIEHAGKAIPILDASPMPVPFPEAPPMPPPARRDWIQTLEGRVLTPRNLQCDQVGSIEEIAHALAGKVRFTGQTKVRYSVAEHCVRGSQLLPAAFAGAFLLHELSEVYLPDIAAPLKPFVFVERMNPANVPMPWSDLERQHTATILDALDLSSIEPLIYSPEVKRMDVAMLLAEKRDLMGPEPEPWNIPGEPACTGRIFPMTADEAEAQFLARFAELFR